MRTRTGVRAAYSAALQNEYIRDHEHRHKMRKIYMAMFNDGNGEASFANVSESTSELQQRFRRNFVIQFFSHFYHLRWTIAGLFLRLAL